MYRICTLKFDIKKIILQPFDSVREFEKMFLPPAIRIFFTNGIFFFLRSIWEKSPLTKRSFKSHSAAEKVV